VTTQRRSADALEWLLLACLVVLFVAKGLLPAWRDLNTDFPNYLLAAKLYRQGVSLASSYDWTWFQRQKDHASFDRGIVGYIPLTPYSALLFVPIAGLPPLMAKHCWLLVNLGMLAGTVLLLRSLTALPLRRIAIVLFLTVVPLQTGFQFGQQHVLILLLCALAVWLASRGRDSSAGVVIALAAAIKLYPALLAIFFAWKRRWRALGGLAAGGLVLGLVSVPLFGKETIRVYATEVLPRSLTGEGNDPYYLGFNTLAVLLRSLFLAEPDLNPHPAVPSVLGYVLLQPGISGFCLGMTLWALGLAGRRQTKREGMEWGVFLALLLVLSTASSTYHFALLVLPTVLAVDFLVREGQERTAVVLLTLHAVVCAPLSRWVPAAAEGWGALLGVPRLYALWAYWGVLLFVVTRESRAAARRDAVLAMIAGAVYALLGVRALAKHYSGVRNASARVEGTGAPVPMVAPAAHSGEIYYSQMAEEGYDLRANRAGVMAESRRGLDLFHPALSEEGHVGFVELASDRSRIASFVVGTGRIELTSEVEDGEDPAVSRDGRWLAFRREGPRAQGALWLQDRRGDEGTRAARRVTDDGYDVLELNFFSDERVVFSARVGDALGLFVASVLPGPVTAFPTEDERARYPAASPDGRWLAYSGLEGGAWQLRLVNLVTHAERRLTSEDCNSVSPAWEGDSQSLVYASDCRRNLGNTALYRIRLSP